MASELNWTNVNIEQLPTAIRAQYDAMKAGYRAYAAKKAEFEAAMQAAYGSKLLADAELKFGYNFGKLSVAVGPKRERKAASAKAQQGTLADWLQAQSQANRAA